MEGNKSFGGKLGFLLGLLSIYLLICCTKIEGAKDDPRRNVNLTPFIEWESAAQCMQNKSSSCQDKYQLGLAGWPNVTKNDTAEYCNGCAQHTVAVLDCLHDVKRDMKFGDKTTVKDLNFTIAHGCTSGLGFNGQVMQYSNAERIYGSKAVLFVAALAASFLINHINM